jgi:hypothetical protein
MNASHGSAIPVFYDTTLLSQPPSASKDLANGLANLQEVTITISRRDKRQVNGHVMVTFEARCIQDGGMKAQENH